MFLIRRRVILYRHTHLSQFITRIVQSHWSTGLTNFTHNNNTYNNKHNLFSSMTIDHLQTFQTKQWAIDINKTRDELLSDPCIHECSELLQQNNVIALPTETVYGLAGNALSDDAIQRIYHAKGRPSDNPLIVHCSDIAAVQKIAVLNKPDDSGSDTAQYDTANALAYKLAQTFWPGPLTIVLPSISGRLSKYVTASLDTVAIRIPSHPITLSILQYSQLPLAAPSANLSGRPSPTRAQHVHDDLNTRISGIVDSGTCGVGVESTVVECTIERGNIPTITILRPGIVTKSIIEELFDNKVSVQYDPAIHEAQLKHNLSSSPRNRSSTTLHSQSLSHSLSYSSIYSSASPLVIHDSDMNGIIPRAPGMKYQHYAPQAPLYIIDGDSEVFTRHIQHTLDQRDLKIGLLVTQELCDSIQQELGGAYKADRFHICISGNDANDLHTVAITLYDHLRGFDSANVHIIYAQLYPNHGIGEAIMNRLDKAAAHKYIYQSSDLIQFDD